MGTDSLTRARTASSTPLIDPRLRDRRIEVARDEGRRRLRRVLWVLLVLVAIGGAIAATQSPLLDVDRIEVTGVPGSQADEVRSASGIELGDALVTVDGGAAVARLEALPWVAGASVARSWPSTVEIAIEVRTPVAVVGDDPGMRVDATGQALGPATDGDASRLPRIDAAAPALGESLPDGAGIVAEVLGGLPQELRSQVSTAGHRSNGVVLELRDGIEVTWGDATEATAKADALRVLLGQDDRGSFEQIDVSVPRASTITFRDEGGE